MVPVITARKFRRFAADDRMSLSSASEVEGGDVSYVPTPACDAPGIRHSQSPKGER
jgi:hypothetical protein